MIVLSEMGPMSKQELRQTAFNEVWKTFVTNKAPLAATFNSSGAIHCHYRVLDKEGSVSAACAIGVLVSDDEAKSLSATGGIELCHRVRVAPEWVDEAGAAFCGELQKVHDDVAAGNIPLGIADALQEFARDYGLSLPGKS